ncbi:MAG: AMP-binding protein [Clostridiales bacterium]|jgi:acyl-CoA synthetase (AMP-forming)/AMP-acid ligase II|nr:AMP-binding protein [Clostridiales bacterium]
MNLWKFLKERMAGYGGKTALVCGGESLAYAELIGLAERGEHISDKCTVAVEDNPDRLQNAVGLLRALAGGRAAVPLNPEYGAAYCERIRAEIFAKRDMPPDPDIALIMFTSGSSGKPKGVMLSHENVISNISAIGKYFQIKAGDSILIARPLSHAAVLTGEFFVSLYKGLTVHLYNESFSPRRLASYMAEHKITVFCATPTLLNLLCRSIREGGKLPLKHMAVSGERLPKETAIAIAGAFPDTDIYSVYGLTEASPRVSCLPPDKFRSKPGSVGVPIDGVQMRILDNGGEKAANGAQGRLWVKSAGVMRGYLGRPELTESKIKDGWLDTGDIAYKDEDGYFHIVGRADNMIIRSGMNIYPEEVEGALLSDGRIEKALCYAEPDALTGRRVCVKVVGNATVREVAETARKTLPAFMRPSRIEVVADLERTASGKTARKRV